MISPVTLRPLARLDLLEQFVYLAEEAHPEMAERYYSAVVQTCAMLVDQPTIRESMGLQVCDVFQCAVSIGI